MSFLPIFYAQCSFLQEGKNAAKKDHHKRLKTNVILFYWLITAFKMLIINDKSSSVEDNGGDIVRILL